MKKKIKGRLLEAPAILILIGAFFVSLYLKVIDYPITNGAPLSWGPTILLGLSMVLYFWGRYVEHQEDALVF